MSAFAGIIFAFVALLAWGFGDFFIQKTTRLLGSWKALFFIGIVGAVVLFPFIRSELFALSSLAVLLLGIVTVVMLFTALFDFEALRQGKLAIVEPIIGLELPLTVGLSLTLGGEQLSVPQLLLIALIFIGIILAVTAHHTRLHYHRRIFEKGVMFAGIGAVGMALANFLVGTASQTISPLMTIWFVHSSLAVICGAYLLARGEFGALVADVRNHLKPIIGQSVLENVAWLAFAFATAAIPIAVATTISETYIALAVSLGIFVNREKLRRHQIIGVALAVIGVLALAYISW